MLAANRDLVLEAAANTQKLDGKNSSSGGNVGVSLGLGGSGGGLSVFANGNKGTGFEHGNGTTWTETTVDAGRQVTLVSGRDTSLIGAQVSGEQITAKVGRDLTLRSLQDTDEYQSEQKNVSAGVSVAIIGSGGSASLSVDKSKIHSNYDSVQEQTGLYAGKGGYDIDVGKHTQLDGAVISSTASADKNRLSTDTLGWRDIRNEADYKTQQQGVSVSSGGGDGPMFIGNAPNGMVTAYTHGDSDSGTTRSAISAGTIDIRNGEAQQQDVASLSRDVEHANGSISPIFDKEKEQRRLQEVQLIAQIGSQSMDIIRTNGEIKANEEGRKALEKDGKYPPGEGASADEIKKYNDALVNSKAYQDVMREYGTGSDYQKTAQAVTAALQYLAGGDIGGAVAGASAPYVARLIKDQTGDNDTARIMAQTVLGAIVANAQGNSGVAGAAGAATGELIAQQLYPNKPHDQLTENERQIVSALSTLAAGMAGGLASGDSAGAFAAAGAGKTAVENNDLGSRLYLDRKVEEFAAAGNCGGMSTESCRAKYAEKVFEEGGGANGVMLSVLMGVGAPVAAALGPELLMACIANPAVCTEASLAGAEVPFGAATAGGTALGMGGFGGLIGKEVSAGADAAATLPIGYREGSAAGSGFAATAGLPDGYRRVINTKTGNTEVLAADGKLYLETSNGLQPKVGGNLSALSEAERSIKSQRSMSELISQFADKATLPKDFTLNINGLVLRADPIVSKNAPVYIGASDDMVKSYFSNLAGVSELPVPKNIEIRGQLHELYTLVRSDGVKLNLRSGSSSGAETGAKWTIDIIGAPGIKAPKIEVKFK